jgi:glycosyltransferase involved in cell wall biosynthesis
VEAHVEAVATRLAARGHRVGAYVRRWYSGDARAFQGVELLGLPTLHTKHLDATVHSALAAGHAAARGFDVVHFHALGPSLFCWVPRLARCRVVVTIHALDYRQAKWGPFAKAALRAGEGLALRAADRTLVVSRELAEGYARRGQRVTEVANGVTLGEPVAPARIRAELGLSGGDYALFLGRWIPERQLVELIETWRRKGPWPWRLVVAGDDPDSGAYGRAVRQAVAGAADIALPGMVEGALKAELLSNAAVVLAPSRHEGLPIALLEAMAYGRMVVASDIAPHREALGDSRAGLLFPAGRPADMADALRRLSVLAPDQRAQLGARGRERVAHAYAWDSVVDRLEAIYAQVVSGVDPPGAP